MENDQVLVFEYEKGEQKVFPAHWMVKRCFFKADEKEEATLVNSLAVVAEKNGMSVNDISHLFPHILRMLKSQIEWAK